MFISVIIPIYNGEKYLGDTIMSIINQKNINLNDIEIIACDDGSVDDSVIIAKKYGCRLFELKHGGISHACNYGLEKAQGDAVLFLDQDDLLAADAISVLGQRLLAGGVEAVSGMCRDFLSPDLSPDERKQIKMRVNPYYGLLNGCILMRKELCTRIGSFSSSYRAGQSVDYALRVQSITNIIKIENITIYRRIHAKNTSRVDKNRQYQEYCSIVRRKHRIKMGCR